MDHQYSSNKSKAQLGHSDKQWEPRIVAELDSGLNKWADSLPSHRKSLLPLSLITYPPLANSMLMGLFRRSALEAGAGGRRVPDAGGHA